MHLTTFAFAALVASAAAVEPVKQKWTRAAPFQLGLRVRQTDADTAYAPETTECGEGNSCEQACGAGYVECMAKGEANHCYKPDAGETCCAYTGTGNSCESGYFCAHNKAEETTCCAAGKSLEDCAKVNKVDALEEDPATPTYSPSSKDDETASTKAPKPTAAGDYPTKPATVPEATKPATVNKNAAGRTGVATAAVLLMAGAFAALL